MSKKNYVPFNVWYNVVLDLIEFIKNSDFDVIDQVESYSFNNISFCKYPDTYKFSSTIDGDIYYVPTLPVTGLQGTTVSVSFAGMSVGPSSYVSKNIDNNFSVSITTNRESILKIDVLETIGITDIQNPVNLQKNHSIVFGKNNILVDGVWYSNDTPDAFMHDINNEDVSVLELLNLINDLKFG